MIGCRWQLRLAPAISSYTGSVEKSHETRRAATEPALVLSRARHVAIAAFAVLGVSGMMLFVTEASHLAVNPMFICKQTLVAAGLANVLVFELIARRTIAALPAGAAMPAAGRIAGYLSLAVWIAVAACGRSIAYF